MRTRVLAIDYGLKRIGVAVSDESESYSFSRGYLQNDIKLYTRLLSLIQNENVYKIIIGYPLNFNSEKTEITFLVEKFRELFDGYLKNNSIEMEFEYFDERFTSSLAQYNISKSGLKKKKREEKGLVDSIAAQILLQDYLDKKKSNT